MTYLSKSKNIISTVVRPKRLIGESVSATLWFKVQNQIWDYIDFEVDYQLTDQTIGVFTDDLSF
jgi:hypothetical protein